VNHLRKTNGRSPKLRSPSERNLSSACRAEHFRNHRGDVRRRAGINLRASREIVDKRRARLVEENFFGKFERRNRCARRVGRAKETDGVAAYVERFERRADFASRASSSVFVRCVKDLSALTFLSEFGD